MYFLFTIVATLLLCVPNESAAKPITVKSFFPTGTVSTVGQVKVTFSEDMIAFGDNESATDPFEISCKLPYTTSWLDSKIWVVDFVSHVPPRTTCQFTANPNFVGLDSKIVSPTEKYNFRTSATAIVGTRPYEGGEIKETQDFIAVLSGKVAPEYLQKNLYFEIDGIANRVGIRIIKGNDRREILKRNYFYNEQENLPKVVFSARSRFPNKAKIKLIWQPPQSPMQLNEFRVREAFRATVHCKPIRAGRDCNPLAALSIRFNTPIPTKYLKSIRVKNQKGKILKLETEKYERENNQISTITINGPHKPKSQYTIHMNKLIKDIDHRLLSNRKRFPLTSKFDEFPPLAKFNGTFGIYEYSKDAAIPITVRNLEKKIQGKGSYIANPKSGYLQKAKDLYNSFTTKKGQVPQAQHKTIIQMLAKVHSKDPQYQNWEHSIFKDEKTLGIQSLKIPKVHPSKDMEVVGIPVKKPGFYLFEVKSEKLADAYITGKNKSM
jgi:alpha-2-macroglobulin